MYHVQTKRRGGGWRTVSLTPYSAGPPGFPQEDDETTRMVDDFGTVVVGIGENGGILYSPEAGTAPPHMHGAELRDRLRLNDLTAATCAAEVLGDDSKIQTVLGWINAELIEDTELANELRQRYPA